jgi:hypothetical protein
MMGVECRSDGARRAGSPLIYAPPAALAAASALTPPHAPSHEHVKVGPAQAAEQVFAALRQRLIVNA